MFALTAAFVDRFAVLVFALIVAFVDRFLWLVGQRCEGRLLFLLLRGQALPTCTINELPSGLDAAVHFFDAHGLLDDFAYS